MNIKIGKEDTEKFRSGIMGKRILTVLITLPLFMFFIVKGGLYIFLLSMVLSIVGLYEFYEAIKNDNKRPINWLGFLVVILLLFISYFNLDQTFYLFIFFIASYVLLTLNIFSKKDRLVDSALTIFGVIYIGIGFSHLIMISKFDNKLIIFIPFMISWSTDTFAYFTGKYFGSKKLYPSVSPNKTIEGAVGGVIGSVIINYIFVYFFVKDILAIIIVISLFGSIFSQIGDLLASKIKRSCGIKDFGKILPGHGGVLDRFDSALVTIPFVYYCIYIFKILS